MELSQELFEDLVGIAGRTKRGTRNQGNAKAQNNLGGMYGTGKGVAQDYVQAHMWFNLAAAGLPTGEIRDMAVSRRDLAEKRMTPALVAEAQRLAREWKPKVEAKN